MITIVSVDPGTTAVNIFQIHRRIYNMINKPIVMMKKYIMTSTSEYYDYSGD